MPFNLRGGRPKNMGQGVYWVQRHLADQRASDRAHAVAQRDADKARATAALTNRYEHIVSAVVSFFRENASVDVDARGLDRFNSALESWNTVKQLECVDGAALSTAKLNKLATAAKNVIIAFARPAGIDTEWSAALKRLRIGNKNYDFG